MHVNTHYSSPNFNERTLPVSLLVMHYTGMVDGDAALERLCDAQAAVSAHYLVQEDGTIHHLVSEEHRAWHAGAGGWRGIKDINSASIGIEIVNPGHEFGYRPFPDAQMKAVLALSKHILARHTILPRDVIGHSDLAPQRKEDPGELFNWRWLAQKGVGVFPNTPLTSPAETQHSIADIQKKLAVYGYDIESAGKWDETSTAVARAFQRHFRPTNFNGEWDAECSYLLDSLLEKI